MAAKTYAVVQHVVSPPAIGRRILAVAGSPNYARIECRGAAGESMVLEYLRPDTVLPYDLPADGGPLPNTYDGTADAARVYRQAFHFAWDRDLLASGQQVFAEVDGQVPGGMRIFAPVQLLPQAADPVPDVGQWLGQNAAVATSIRWAHPGAAALTSFPSWPAQWQQDLADAFSRAWNAVPGGLPDPPPSLGTDPNDVIVGQAHAWGLYLEHVAQSLAVEIRGAVPWSLGQLSPDDRDRVLSSRELFSQWGSDYRVESEVVPASPLFVYSFLRRNDLVGPTRMDTIGRLLEWCVRNLRHFYADPDWAQVHWQYPGVPVRRMIDGTVSSLTPQLGRRHWTAGCAGTSPFLRCVLRVVNIPAEAIPLGDHATAWFTSEARWLSHGDDPYSSWNWTTPPFPASELLIDQAKFDGWFGPAVPAAERAANVGRRPHELALQHLPDDWLHAYWQDATAGLSPQNGRLYNGFLKNVFPDLNAILPLWPALQAKLAGFPRMGEVLVRLRLPLLLVRFLPPWVPVLLQKIPLLAVVVRVVDKSR